MPRPASEGRVVQVMAALALAATSAACGIGGASDGGVATHRGLRVPTGLERGCGEEARTSPTDVAGDRQVARCAAGAPAAQPLPAPVSLRVGVRAPAEELAPLLLADRLGAFAAENLTVEVVELPGSRELYAALERGEVDAVAGDLDAAFFDSAHQGSGVRLVLGGAVAPDAGDLSTDQSGLWVRRDATSRPDRWRDLKNHRIAIEDGIGDVAAYPIAGLLRQDDVTLNDMHPVSGDGATAAEQLLSREVDAAWLPEPHWREVARDGAVRLVATLPSEPLGGVVVSERLLDGARDRPVGVAFVRAMVRTVNTYLADDYQSDDDVLAALADATGQSEDDVAATPPWVFDWELRSGTTTRIQKALVDLGGVLYEEELPEAQLVDRSLYEDAVGA